MEKYSIRFTNVKNRIMGIQTLLLGKKRDNALYKVATTRNIKIPDIEVIPDIYKDNVEHLDDKLESIYYLVKLPIYKFQQCLIPKNDDSTWTFADIKYSYDEGATSCN